MEELLEEEAPDHTVVRSNPASRTSSHMVNRLRHRVSPMVNRRPKVDMLVSDPAKALLQSRAEGEGDHREV